MIDIWTLIIGLLMLAGLIVLITLAVKAAGSPRRTTVVVPPGTAPAGTTTVTVSRGGVSPFLFWMLLALTTIFIFLAVWRVQELRTGTHTIREWWYTNAALLLGVILAGLSAWWFSLAGPRWPAHKVGGTVAAIAAGILLIIGLWNLFLRSWWNETVLLAKKAKGMDLTLPTGWKQDWALMWDTNSEWIIGLALLVLAIVLIIAMIRTPALMKTIGTILVVIVGISLILWLWNDAKKSALLSSGGKSEEKQELRFQPVHIETGKFTAVDWLPDASFNTRTFKLDDTRPHDLVCYFQQEDPRTVKKEVQLKRRHYVIPAGSSKIEGLPATRSRMWVTPVTTDPVDYDLTMVYWQ